MIKVIEGMKPSEVLKAVEDGETKVVWFNNVIEEWREWKEPVVTVETAARAIGNGYKLAIIDDSQPVIDWGGFDWEFFNQWDGVRIAEPEEVRFNHRHWTLNSAPLPSCESTLVQSPFYPWFGGKQPVPDGVEVEVSVVEFTLQVESTVVRNHITLPACDVMWDLPTIVAFRLTGRVQS